MDVVLRLARSNFARCAIPTLKNLKTMRLIIAANIAASGSTYSYEAGVDFQHSRTNREQKSEGQYLCDCFFAEGPIRVLPRPSSAPYRITAGARA